MGGLVTLRAEDALTQLYFPPPGGDSGGAAAEGDGGVLSPPGSQRVQAPPHGRLHGPAGVRLPGGARGRHAPVRTLPRRLPRRRHHQRQAEMLIIFRHE